MRYEYPLSGSSTLNGRCPVVTDSTLTGTERHLSTARIYIPLERNLFIREGASTTHNQ